jgi:hypothetical protein
MILLTFQVTLPKSVLVSRGENAKPAAVYQHSLPIAVVPASATQVQHSPSHVLGIASPALGDLFAVNRAKVVLITIIQMASSGSNFGGED